MIGRVQFVVCGLILACIHNSAPAQVFVRPFQPTPAVIEELSPAGKQVAERAVRFAAENQPTEAADALQELLDLHGGQLQATDSFTLEDGRWERFLPVSLATQHRLQSWQTTHPAIWKTFCERYAKQAEREFAAAAADRDKTRLQQTLRKYRASPTAADYLCDVGDAALEAGDFQRARAVYEQLHPLAPMMRSGDFHSAGSELWQFFREKPATLAWQRLREKLTKLHPSQATAQLATMLSRLTLVSLLAGDSDRAEIELTLLERLAPDASGWLAGKEANYVATLRELQKLRKPNLQPSAPTTFAVAATRSGVYPFAWQGEALRRKWSLPLPSLPAAHDVLSTGRRRIADDEKWTLAYHPLVVGEHVFLRADQEEQATLTAYSLAEGKPVWNYSTPLPATDEVRAPVQLGLRRFTLTTAEGALFTKLGSSITAVAARKLDQIRSTQQGFLVGLDIASEGKPREGFPQYPAETEQAWEGPPLVAEGKLYVAWTQRAGNRRRAWIACYELLTTPTDTSQGKRDHFDRGRLLWKTHIATADTPGSGEWDELTHTLLAKHEGLLFINTNLGAVAAVDAEQGRIEWLVRYPRMAIAEQPTERENCYHRDLTPPVVHRGRVVFAPADSPRIFAVHETSGLPAWAAAPEQTQQLVQLLGATGDWVIASGERVVWFDLFNGAVAGEFPAANTTGSQPFGRGCLTQTYVCWPTKDAVHLLPLDPRDLAARGGKEANLMRRIDLKALGIPSGNLTPYAGGLLIAGNRQLSCLAAE